MKPFLFASLALLVVGLGLACSGPESPAEWKLLNTEALKWAARIRKVVPDKGWTVEVRGSDVIVQRDMTVRFQAILPGGSTKPHLSEGPYRITLRFASKMSYDDYEKRLAENTAMDQKREKLRQAVNVPSKDDEFSPRTPEEEARVEKYQQTAQKLVRHNLPDLYSPDHSIYVFQSWYGDAWVVDKDVARECDAVEVGLLQFFGGYGARTEGRRAGCWRMEATRLPDGVKPPTR